MKKAVLLLTLISLISCEKEKEKTDAFFNPENLESLELANIDGFWEDISSIDTSYGGAGGVIFDRFPGFLQGIGLNAEKKSIWVTVFSSRDTAVMAMEHRIEVVSSVILEGTSNEINGTWWYAKSPGTVVFKNQWNTIIEVMNSQANNDSIKDIVYRTVN